MASMLDSRSDERTSGAGAPLIRWLAVVAAVAALLGAAALLAVLLALGDLGGGTRRVTTIVEQAPPARLPVFDPAAIYTRAVPGVVDINATGATTSGRTTTSWQSVGSGFEIDGRGDVLTAAHVVQGASSIVVKLPTGSPRRARLIASDSSSDAAVVRFDPTGLPLHPVALGSARQVKVGDPVAAIGDPYGYDRSFSTGVVSALGRTIEAPNGVRVLDAIQTDAAINPGSSGGPLLGAQAQVIGIVNQIATSGSRSDSYTGVAFAVPIDAVRALLARVGR